MIIDFQPPENLNKCGITRNVSLVVLTWASFYVCHILYVFSNLFCHQLDTTNVNILYELPSELHQSPVNGSLKSKSQELEIGE